MNTQQEYTHYSFVFQNEDMQLKASGNYMITIYEDGNQENVVVRLCFQVVEPLVEIETKVRANTDVEFNGRYQQLDIDVHTGELDLKNAGDVALLVQQNGRIDNQQYILKPTFVEPNRLRYVNQRALIFEGGNEFRRFDSYSTYYAGYNVNSVVYEQGEYAVRGDIIDIFPVGRARS
jgi:transcription-repair coupling factor (superfamily II helicase)